MSRESPIFSRSHDLTSWVATAVRRFPRDQRFTFATRLLGLAFALDDALVAASVDGDSAPAHLVRADVQLGRLRRSLFLAQEQSLISLGQYQHASRMTAEIGRLLGGWKRSLERG